MTTAIDYKQAQHTLENADLLHSAEEITVCLDDLAKTVNADFAGQDSVIFTVMNGGVVLAGMLMTRLTFPFRFDYLHATRYREKTSGSDLHWLKRNDIEIAGKSVLVIDDILDEGYTLEAIVDELQKQSPAELKTLVLAEKQHDRTNGFKADYIGLKLIDRYVFGMGMDYCGYLRHLPAIYAVKGM